MVASQLPLQYLIAAFGLGLNRQQQDVIDYLKEENQLLKAKLGVRKIQFTDGERCRLAIRAKALGRKLLSQMDTLIQISTRSVKIAGITTSPNEAWVMRMGRNMSHCETGLLVGKRKLIIDRDTKYCQAFRRLLEQSGTAIIRLPPRSPNLNAYAERFVRSIKEECVQHVIFFGEASLRRALSEYMTHFHQERNHQGMNKRLLYSAANDDSYYGSAASKRARLGGILNYYYREAA